MKTHVAIVFGLLAVTSFATLHAKEPYQEWMEFFPGVWDYEYPTLGGGQVFYRPAPRRHAVVADGTEANSTWTELIGWRAGSKQLVFSGYGAKGTYWQNESTELSAKRILAKSQGLLPDGRHFTGTVTLSRVDNDVFEVQISGQVAGQTYNEIGKFTRQHSVGAGMPASIREQLDRLFVGDWRFTWSYDGQEGTGNYTVRWSPGQDTVTGSQIITTPQGQVRASVLLGWDAGNTAMVTHYFCDNGDHLTLECSTLDASVWKGKVSGTFQGEKIDGPAEIRWGDGQAEYESTANGKKYLAVFTRQ